MLPPCLEAGIMARIQQLLVPTDFSPTSDIALRYAFDIAPVTAAIHVLHVVDETRLVAAYPDGFVAELPGARDELVASAYRRLHELTKRPEATPVAVTTEVVVGRPAAAIAATAKARQADVIVMGTHGRGAFAHALLGSVAERVLRSAPCPVLTVRDNSRTADEVADELVAARRAAHV
jgi:universal stress protein A